MRDYNPPNIGPEGRRLKEYAPSGDRPTDLGQRALRSSSQDFYAGEGNRPEAERLAMMAEYADGVSVASIVEAIGTMKKRGGAVVLDVGAGDSVSLGKNLKTLGYAYLPVDVREEAVAAQVAAGFDAEKAQADKLPFESASVDIVHARFTLGWLSEEDRNGFLREVLRVGKVTSAGVFIDYDWSVVDGPELFMEGIAQVRKLLADFGFNPDYGKVLHDDIKSSFADIVKNGRAFSKKDPLMQTTESRYASYAGSITGAMPIIRQTVEAIKTKLQEYGMVDDVAKLDDVMAGLESFAKSNPDEEVRLSDIVAVNVIVQNNMQIQSDTPEKRSSAYIGTQEYRRGIDYKALPFGAVLANVVEAKSTSFIQEVRRLQAAAYVQDRIVSNEAVDAATGGLTEMIDPGELIARSRYFASLLVGNDIGGCVRAIYPDGERGVRSLPTIDRIMRHSPETAAELSEHPVMDPTKKVIEVSALAKNMLRGSLNDVVDAVLAMAETVRREGCDYAVMGLQESKVRLIEGVFGKDAIQRISGADAVHPVDLPGVKDNVKFVPLVVDARLFIDMVNIHALQMVGASQDPSGLFASIVEKTRVLISGRATHDSVAV